MPFSIRSFRRFPVQCSVTYNAGLFHGQGTVWNLSCTGWRLSGDLPMRPGGTLPLTVTLPNEQRIVVPESVIRWSRVQEFAAENRPIEPHTQARLQYYVKRLVQERYCQELWIADVKAAVFPAFFSDLCSKSSPFTAHPRSDSPTHS